MGKQAQKALNRKMLTAVSCRRGSNGSFVKGERVLFRGNPGTIEDGPDADGDYIVTCDNGERFTYASSHDITTEQAEAKRKLIAERKAQEVERKEKEEEARKSKNSAQRAKEAADRKELESMDLTPR